MEDKTGDRRQETLTLTVPVNPSHCYYYLPLSVYPPSFLLLFSPSPVDPLHLGVRGRHTSGTGAGPRHRRAVPTQQVRTGEERRVEEGRG